MPGSKPTPFPHLRLGTLPFALMGVPGRLSQGNREVRPYAMSTYCRVIVAKYFPKSEYADSQIVNRSHGGPRARTSLDSYGPILQKSTSGMAFDDSDKENAQKDVRNTPTTIQTKRSPFSRSVLREIDVRAIRNSALTGMTGSATGAIRN